MGAAERDDGAPVSDRTSQKQSGGWAKPGKGATNAPINAPTNSQNYPYPTLATPTATLLSHEVLATIDMEKCLLGY